MNLTKVKQILCESIDSDMFDDAEVYHYLLECISKIDAEHNEIDEVQMTILLTISSSIATTLRSIAQGEHDKTVTEQEKHSAQEKERTIVEFLDYLTNNCSTNLVNDVNINKEAYAQ